MATAQPTQTLPPAGPHPTPTNARSFYDGEMSVLSAGSNEAALASARRTTLKEMLRSGGLPVSLPPPGDPKRQGLALAQMSWTVRADLDWAVTAVPLRSTAPCFGYLAQEGNR